MKAVIKQLAAGPLRYAVRFVLKRPWLKKRLRDMAARMSRNGLLMRVMFQAMAMAQPKVRIDQKHLSSDARRVQRALKQAIRTHRR